MMLRTLTPFILLVYCLTSASVGMAQSMASGKEWVDPVTGMTFVYVKGGCYQMGCEDNSVLASTAPHQDETANKSNTDIPVWQWPLAVVAAFLPVGCVYGRGYYDRTVCAPDEQPVHEVCVDSFWMSKYEVTRAEFRKVMRSHPRPAEKRERYPVTNLSIEDIETFLSKLTVRFKRKNSFSIQKIRSYPVYRLPTEAEWEYAARSGGRMEKYAGGNNADSIGWYYENSGNSSHEVGTKAPNGLGLYDMSGNVKEVCADWYDSAYYTSSPRNNPRGPAIGAVTFIENSIDRSKKPITYKGLYPVHRGGSWADDAGHLTTVKRTYELRPEFIISSRHGFRPVFSEERGSTGSLFLEISPPDARIRIRNIASRYVPGMELEKGSYQLEVSRSGYITAKQSVSISANEDTTMPVHLEKIPQPTTGPAAGETSWTEPITGMEFVFVLGSCFQMGSPRGEEGHTDNEKQHQVCVDGIWMGKYEVTNEQFRKLQPGHDSKEYEGRSLNGDSQPVVQVSWEEARDYARSLSGKSGWNFRLPTEAEWEYAARAGTSSARFWGESPDQVCEFANVQDGTAGKTFHMSWRTIQNCFDGYAVTAPVGSFKPNGYGLYDMLGNVSELCSDWYDDDYYTSSPGHNPQGPSSGYDRVLRGGNWRSYEPGHVRSASRSACQSDYRRNANGFRLAFSQGNR